jgi:hypothetical protein
MENFGTYLLRTRVISSAQLEEATQSQVIFGGRLGTNLAELGYVDLDDLRKHLSDHLAIPLPNPEWVEHPSEEARESLPRELVEKFRVLPLQLEKRKLHLAMIDPRDPIQLDEIAFATGLILVPYVLPEVQLLALIEHYYGVRREIRYINLGRDAARGNRVGPKPNPKRKSVGLAPEGNGDSGDPFVVTQQKKVSVGVHATVPVGEHATANSATVSASQAQFDDLIDEDLFSEIHERKERSVPETSEKPVEVRTPPEPAFTMEDVNLPAAEKPHADSPGESIASMEADLGRARDRDAVSELALRIARRYADAAALFVARGEIVSGFRGDGDRISTEISGILLAAGFDSSLTAPVSSRVAFRGAAPTEGFDAKILSSLGRGDAQEIAVFPILIRGQVVNLLYTDNGSDVLGETGFAALETLACLVSCAYERLILERKSAIA